MTFSKNFKYLDDLIHRGVKEIVLGSDIILGEEEKSKYKNGIKLDVDDLIIDGNGHVIDACRRGRIFECTAKNITLKNIRLKNGYTRDEGGAIVNTDKLTIENSIFVGNTANNGGAIFNMRRLKHFTIYHVRQLVGIIRECSCDNHIIGWHG